MSSNVGTGLSVKFTIVSAFILSVYFLAAFWVPKDEVDANVDTIVGTNSYVKVDTNIHVSAATNTLASVSSEADIGRDEDETVEFLPEVNVSGVSLPTNVMFVVDAGEAIGYDSLNTNDLAEIAKISPSIANRIEFDHHAISLLDAASGIAYDSTHNATNTYIGSYDDGVRDCLSEVQARLMALSEDITVDMDRLADEVRVELGVAHIGKPYKDKDKVYIAAEVDTTIVTNVIPWNNEIRAEYSYVIGQTPGGHVIQPMTEKTETTMVVEIFKLQFEWYGTPYVVKHRNVLSEDVRRWVKEETWVEKDVSGVEEERKVEKDAR